MTPPPAISVIVPVYNAESQIRRCLDSLHAQNFTDFETICIDDGSTDNSLALLHSHPLPHLRILSQPNQGLSAVRNRGLDEAQGHYICFVDGDDFLDPDYLSSLYAAAQRTGAEVIMAPTRYITPDSVKHDSLKESVLYHFIDKINSMPHGGACNKLYLTSFLKQHRILFPVGLLWEDNIFTAKVCRYCTKLAIITDSCYNYIENQYGITRDTERANKRKNDSLTMANLLMQFAHDEKFTAEEKAALTYYCRHFIQQANMLDATYYTQLCSILPEHSFLTTMRAREHRRRWREKKRRIRQGIIRILTFGLKS